MQEGLVRRLRALVHRHYTSFNHRRSRLFPSSSSTFAPIRKSSRSYCSGSYFLNEEHVVEILYCTHHERLYDVTEHQWIPLVRGEVRLVQTIYPRRGDLHIWEHVCDVCIRVSQGCCGWQLESRLARVPHVASPQPCRNTRYETDVLTASTPAFVMLERDTTVHGAKRYTHSQ